MIRATIYIPSLRHKLAAAIHILATMPAMLALPLALTTSCATDELVSPVTPIPGQQVTITASLGGGDHATPDTRMDYTPNDDTSIGGLLTTWAEGDAFNITTFGNTAQTFTLVTGAGTSTGTFGGTAPDADEEYLIYHPSTIKSSGEFLNFAYTGQIQQGNDNLAHLTAYHSMELLTDNYTTIDFSNPRYQSSCMKFVLTLPDVITPRKITLASADGSTCFFTNNGEYAKVDAKANASSLSLDLENFDATNTITAYMMMAYLDVTLPAAGITVTVVAADGSNYTQTIVPASDKLSLAGGMMHTITASNMAKKVAKMTFKVRVDETNGLGFNIPFYPYEVTPADMTVTWEEGGTSVKIPKGTFLDSSPLITHTYDTAGEYTITITSAEIDAMQKQMPTFNFFQYGKDNNNALKLISMDSPMLNTGSLAFERCFQDCTALTTIHTGLLENNTQVVNFSNCFQGCTALNAIPAGLFENNTAAENFYFCFSKCTALTAIPPGLFEKNTAAENFKYCFEACSKLKLNANIFSTAAAQNNTHFKDKTVDFSYCFYNVGADLTNDEVKNSIAPELWDYDKGTGNWTTEKCFGKYEYAPGNTGKFGNSTSIPSDWKQ